MSDMYQDYSVSRIFSKKQTVQEALLAKYGKRYSEYRNNWGLAAQGKTNLDFPLHLDFDTIDSCNLTCRFCNFANTNSRTRDAVPLCVVDAAFDEASLHGGLCAVNVGSGGEPLLKKEMLLHILDRARQANVMETFVHTNALLLDNALSEKLVERGLNFLCVSVDAADAQDYKAKRGGDFERLTRNIQQFLAIRDRKSELFPIIRLSFLEEGHSEEFREKVIERWGEIADIIDFQPLIDCLSESVSEIKQSCFHPWMRMAIGVHGEMGPCCNHYAFKEDLCLGTLPTDSIRLAWNSPKMEAIRASLIRKDFKAIPSCYECLSRWQS